MPLLVLLWLASAFASEPGQPAEPVPAAPSAPSPPSIGTAQDPVVVSFATQLNQAKRAYFEGRITEALRLFQRLEVRLKVNGEEPPWEEAAEAMTYLGEIHLSQNHPEAAEEAFRWVLERDLETPMRSPYRHPMEVVTLFEDVRAKVAREGRDLVPPPPTILEPQGPPWWVVVPFGYPQFRQGRPLAGVVYGWAQLGLGIASIVTFVNLDAFNGDPGNDLAEAEFPQQFRTQRAVQWSLTGGALLSWGFSAADASVAAGKARRRAALTVGASPSGAPVLALHGRL